MFPRARPAAAFVALAAVLPAALPGHAAVRGGSPGSTVRAVVAATGEDRIRPATGAIHLD